MKKGGRWTYNFECRDTDLCLYKWTSGLMDESRGGGVTGGGGMEGVYGTGMYTGRKRVHVYMKKGRGI